MFLHHVPKIWPNTFYAQYCTNLFMPPCFQVFLIAKSDCLTLVCVHGVNHLYHFSIWWVCRFALNNLSLCPPLHGTNEKNEKCWSVRCCSPQIMADELCVCVLFCFWICGAADHMFYQPKNPWIQNFMVHDVHGHDCSSANCTAVAEHCPSGILQPLWLTAETCWRRVEAEQCWGLVITVTICHSVTAALLTHFLSLSFISQGLQEGWRNDCWTSEEDCEQHQSTWNSHEERPSSCVKKNNI